MDYRKIVGIVVVIGLTIFLLILLGYGQINLVEFLTGVAVTVFGLIAIIAYWTFKPELSKLFKDGVGNINSNYVEDETKKPDLTVEYDESNIKQYSPFVDGHRVLRIRVRNKGDVKAKKCEARVEVFNYDDSRVTEEIYVIWTKNSKTKSDIPKRDSVFLNVVFSTKDSLEGNIVFVAHPKSSDFSKPPRISEGLKVGNYKLKIRIKPPNSDLALYTNFDLHVKDNWEEITMSKIDEYLRSE